ncbi:zinc-binding dehydrogenase [Thermoproteota archaeon]
MSYIFSISTFNLLRITSFSKDAKMKAIIFYEYGDLSQLKYVDVSSPKIQQGEALIRVKASALNHLDIWERMGGVPLPHISGSDIAGEVAELEKDTTGFDVGDKVVVFPVISCGQCDFCLIGETTQCRYRQLIGFQIDGGYAEYVKVPTSNLFLIPSNLSFEEASTIPVAGSTAWRMLISKSQLNKNSKVLIHGSSSSVSLFAVQIAKIFGAKVILTTNSSNKAKKALKLGADNVINYLEENVINEVKRITRGEGVDIVIDHVGTATFDTSLKSLKRGGKMVSAGVTTGKEVTLDLQYLYRNELTLAGSYLFTMDEFRYVLKMVEEKKLKTIISDVFSLKDAAKAQSLMEQSMHFGKIILKI